MEFETSQIRKSACAKVQPRVRNSAECLRGPRRAPATRHRCGGGHVGRNRARLPHLWFWLRLKNKERPVRVDPARCHQERPKNQGCTRVAGPLRYNRIRDSEAEEIG
jgi:hypothetical protein